MGHAVRRGGAGLGGAVRRGGARVGHAVRRGGAGLGRTVRRRGVALGSGASRRVRRAVRAAASGVRRSGTSVRAGLARMARLVARARAIAVRGLTRTGVAIGRVLWLLVLPIVLLGRGVARLAVLIGRGMARAAALTARAIGRAAVAAGRATVDLLVAVDRAIAWPFLLVGQAMAWPLRLLGRVIARGYRAVSRRVRAVVQPVAAAVGAVLDWPRRRAARVAEVARAKAAADAAARRAALAHSEVMRQATLRSAAMRNAAQRRANARKRVQRLVEKDRARRIRRRRILVAAVVALFLIGAGLATGAYYVDKIPTPAELALPESTAVYFNDGTTVMAKVGSENRTILSYDDMNDAVKDAIVAAEDRTYWTNRGVDLSGVMRAAWNNFTGGATQGASTITQQYVRIAASLRGVTYGRKAREAMLAWKLSKKYSKSEILQFYLNTVPFGRGAYGIEAAAAVYFGKTARRTAPMPEQLTVAEAMVLASLVKQPEPDPDDPVGSPGYDPARGGRAAANAVSRWEYVRDAMVALGYLSKADADAMEYPHTVRSLDAGYSLAGMDRPTGLVVQHVMSELRQSEPFKDEAPDYIRNGGFRIVTTIDPRAQEVAEDSADIRRATAPAIVRGQPTNWQAALVAVQPGTGRVLAYYGGNSGTGADFAGWYYDDDGKSRGFGEHPPGSSFKVYDLAEALREHVSLFSQWDSPPTKEFPASGRTRLTVAGPVRNSSTAPCQPKCMLWQAAVASLNVPFFDLTEQLGAGNVIDMARRAGIDSMWSDLGGRPTPERIDLRGKAGKDLVARSVAGSKVGNPNGKFTTEVGIGQYGVTVLDHANGMATFAAGGKRAQAHFVREVTRDGVRVYAEQLLETDLGLSKEQVRELTWTLSQVAAAKLDNGWDSAGKTGTWQAGRSRTANAHTWMVGYTPAIATAVWLGTADGTALVTKDGSHSVFGSNYAGAIWRQFMAEVIVAMAFDPATSHFQPPQFPGVPRTLLTPRPSPSAKPH
jgi:membrane peptidoglycan carboxypeptidase